MFDIKTRYDLISMISNSGKVALMFYILQKRRNVRSIKYRNDWGKKICCCSAQSNVYVLGCNSKQLDSPFNHTKD